MAKNSAEDRQNDPEKVDSQELPTMVEHAEVEQGPDTQHENEKHVADVDDLDLQNTHAAKPDDSDGKVSWHWRRTVSIVCLAGLYVASQLPLQMAGGSLSYMAADLNHTGPLSWLITANNLAFATVCPFAGHMADLLGKRYITIFAGGCIIVGTIMIATSHSFGQAVAGEAVAGIGGGICELTALAGVSETSPVRLRGFYLGFVTVFILPFAPYLIYTELLGSYASWRWCFWIVVMYAGIWWVGIVLVYFPPPPPRTAGLKKMDIIKKLDWIGAALSIIGITLFLVGLNDGGNRYPWASYQVIVPLVLGVIILVVFVVYTAKWAKHPMVPPAVFKNNRGVVAGLTVATAGGIGLYSVLSFVPLLLQTLYPDESAIQRGVRGVGYGLAILTAATSINMALSLTGRAREILLACVVMMAAFTGSLAHANPFNPNYVTVMAMLAGIGIGGLIVPAATVAMICCPDSVISTITGLSLAVRTLGGALGTSIYSAIFQNKIQSRLPALVAQYAIDAGLPASSAEEFVTTFLTSPSEALSINGTTSAIIEAARLGQRWAYADSLQYVWYAGMAFGLAAGGFCFMIPNLKPYLTNRVAIIH